MSVFIICSRRGITGVSRRSVPVSYYHITPERRTKQHSHGVDSEGIKPMQMISNHVSGRMLLRWVSRRQRRRVIVRERLLLLLVCVVGVLALFSATRAVRGQAIIEVDCFDNNGVCEEVLNPNPLVIPVGAQVQWLFDPTCADLPCSGQCRIDVPAGPGFPGFFDVVNIPGFSNVTPPFNQQGIFYYELECSPVVIGTIIVGNAGMQLFIQGSCPGTVTLEAKSATAGATVFFAYGFASGSTNLPGCAGTSIDIKRARLAGARTADASGVAKLTGFAPASVCGRLFIQAAEKVSCRKSNVGNL